MRRSTSVSLSLLMLLQLLATQERQTLAVLELKGLVCRDLRSRPLLTVSAAT